MTTENTTRGMSLQRVKATQWDDLTRDDDEQFPGVIPSDDGYSGPLALPLGRLQRLMEGVRELTRTAPDFGAKKAMPPLAASAEVTYRMEDEDGHSFTFTIRADSAADGDVYIVPRESVSSSE